MTKATEKRRRKSQNIVLVVREVPLSGLVAKRGKQPGGAFMVGGDTIMENFHLFRKFIGQKAHYKTVYSKTSYIDIADISLTDSGYIKSMERPL